MDESAWGAVPALLLVRFPRNAVLPTSRSIRVMVHPSEPAVLAPRFVATRSHAMISVAGVVHEVEQVVEQASRIGRRPTMKLGLHLRYPPPRTHRHRVDEVVIGWGVTIRCRIFRHYSLQSLLDITSRNHCRPSPCDRLSRPRTTTTAPPRP